MTTEQAVPRGRRSLRPLSSAFAKHFATGTVSETGMVTPAMRRIRITAPAAAGWRYTPGQHVRIQINDPLSLYGLLRPAETLRTYTVVAHCPDEQAFELWAHLYDGTDGIGLSWARNARVNDPVTFWGPQGDLAVRSAPYHLFVGEETASCAFVPLISAVPPSEPVYAVVESDSPRDEVPLPDAHRVCRVHRAGAPAASSPLLPAAVAALDLPATPGVAYVAGEARTCQAVRDHLVRERGWPRSAVTVKPFWTPGKRGLHH
ncbi:siderophore-interacting protein [Pseudonocardia acaciae]|uniref:siderophore-interacting protein n=1 Tax=Pseudonocardia acaciae TaxID=551276 RepID=UPI000686AD00|nr:siderophore-interacting protein [Pseudonocardia acaciae]